MSADLFSDDNDDDDKALVAAADVLEKSVTDRGDQHLKNVNKGTEEDREDTNNGRCQSGFSIQFVKGDLFSCPKTDSLAHCVSRDLRMGKGIAVLFKQKFGGVSELKAQVCRIGEVGILKREGRYIYYLITKAKYSDKPTYQSLESTLRSMKNHCVKYGVKRLSMPRIGCGLDRLVWDNVENTLRKVFGDTDITITVYSI